MSDPEDAGATGLSSSAGSADGRASRRERTDERRAAGRASLGRLVAWFMFAGLGAFVLCGVGLTLAQRHAALVETVRDAEATTTLLAGRVVQPALPAPLPARLDGDEQLDRVIRERVLPAPITRVRIVDGTGLVVYATEAGSAGQRVPLSAAELEALRTGGTTARRDDGADPTRLTRSRAGRSLDVSAGLRAPSGEQLLLQTRQPYEVVWLTSRTVWRSLLPSLLLALALLYLVKAGFAVRLARDLNVVQDQREQLLLTNLAAADRERTLIAADLHDGVVQGLAGASYSLSDAASRTRAAGETEVADTLADTASSLRRWVRELRSLIVTVTPPGLHSEGLRATLSDLLALVEARGISVDLDVQVPDELSETTESLIYRVAQESVRNLVRHAEASAVQVAVTAEDGVVELRVSDDGRGFDTSASARRRGSMGLDLLAALVHQRGGDLRVSSAIGHGTVVTLRLPERAAGRTRSTGSRTGAGR